jgi:hypothetical protein
VGRDKFESICCIPADGFDELWFVVDRVNGRFIERMALRNEYNFCGGITERTALDQLFMDSAVKYSDKKEVTAVNMVADIYYIVTSYAHGFSNGDRVTLRNVAGYPELDNTTWVIGEVTTNTFTLISRVY